MQNMESGALSVAHVGQSMVILPAETPSQYPNGRRMHPSASEGSVTVVQEPPHCRGLWIGRMLPRIAKRTREDTAYTLADSEARSVRFNAVRER